MESKFFTIIYRYRERVHFPQVPNFPLQTHKFSSEYTKFSYGRSLPTFPTRASSISLLEYKNLGLKKFQEVIFFFELRKINGLIKENVKDG